MSVVGAYELCEWLEHINCVTIGGSMRINCVSGWSI